MQDDPDLAARAVVGRTEAGRVAVYEQPDIGDANVIGRSDAYAEVNSPASVYVQRSSVSEQLPGLS